MLDVACTSHIKRGALPAHRHPRARRPPRRAPAGAIRAEGLNVTLHPGGELAHEDALELARPRAAADRPGPVARASGCCSSARSTASTTTSTPPSSASPRLGYGLLLAHPERVRRPDRPARPAHRGRRAAAGQRLQPARRPRPGRAADRPRARAERPRVLPGLRYAPRNPRGDPPVRRTTRCAGSASATCRRSGSRSPIRASCSARAIRAWRSRKRRIAPTAPADGVSSVPRWTEGFRRSSIRSASAWAGPVLIDDAELQAARLQHAVRRARPRAHRQHPRPARARRGARGAVRRGHPHGDGPGAHPRAAGDRHARPGLRPARRRRTPARLPVAVRGPAGQRRRAAARALRRRRGRRARRPGRRRAARPPPPRAAARHRAAERRSRAGRTPPRTTSRPSTTCRCGRCGCGSRRPAGPAGEEWSAEALDRLRARLAAKQALCAELDAAARVPGGGARERGGAGGAGRAHVAAGADRPGRRGRAR